MATPTANRTNTTRCGIQSSTTQVWTLKIIGGFKKEIHLCYHPPLPKKDAHRSNKKCNKQTYKRKTISRSNLCKKCDTSNISSQCAKFEVYMALLLFRSFIVTLYMSVCETVASVTVSWFNFRCGTFISLYPATQVNSAWPSLRE